MALLGAAGCALSYDALRQMAFAIHVRPQLTWLFPIVIDGFIAYGVRALLVLRGAPFRARLYVWTLFAAATAASIWANALHAVRLNQLDVAGSGELHLTDTVVGVLSTIAPLALAGATHLFILISRHGHATERSRSRDLTASPEPGGPLAEQAGTIRSALPADATTAGTAAAMIPAAWVEPAQRQPVPVSGDTSTVPDEQVGTDAAEGPAPVPSAADRVTSEGTVSAHGDEVRAGQRSGGDSGEAVRGSRLGRPADATIPELAQVLATVHDGDGRITRSTARTAIEAAGLSAGNERIKEALELLQSAPAALPHPDAD
nr:DUF2637 domain-containing protein [Streptacidiphilus melanogenes]